MTRRYFTFTPLLLTGAAFAADSPVEIRGKLTTVGSQAATLTLPDGTTLKLEGDEQTTGVLHDQRLNGVEFEILGVKNANGFRIEPIHKRSMYVLQNGKRLFVTYWCAVCAIRTFTPGICWCCQDETVLDLRETLENSNS